MDKSQTLHKIRDIYKNNNLLLLKNPSINNNLTLNELRHLIYPNKLILVKSSLIRLEFKEFGGYYQTMYILEIKDIDKLNFLKLKTDTILIIGNSSYKTTISSVIQAKAIITNCLKKNLSKIQNYLTQI